MRQHGAKPNAASVHCYAVANYSSFSSTFPLACRYRVMLALPRSPLLTSVRAAGATAIAVRPQHCPPTVDVGVWKLWTEVGVGYRRNRCPHVGGWRVDNGERHSHHLTPIGARRMETMTMMTLDDLACELGATVPALLDLGPLDAKRTRDSIGDAHPVGELLVVPSVADQLRAAWDGRR